MIDEGNSIFIIKKHRLITMIIGG